MRTYTCVDCKGVFEAPKARGVLPVRCPKCRVPHIRKQNREKTYRWKARNPDKVKAINDRFNAKYAKDPERLQRRRELWALRTYGINPEQLREMEERQGGKCAICQGNRNGPGSRLHIDHCHTSNRIRGLLCGKCNTMIGLANEDPRILLAAIEYVKES